MDRELPDRLAFEPTFPPRTEQRKPASRKDIALGAQQIADILGSPGRFRDIIEAQRARDEAELKQQQQLNNQQENHPYTDLNGQNTRLDNDNFYRNGKDVPHPRRYMDSLETNNNLPNLGRRPSMNDQYHTNGASSNITSLNKSDDPWSTYGHESRQQLVFQVSHLSESVERLKQDLDDMRRDNERKGQEIEYLQRSHDRWNQEKEELESRARTVREQFSTKYKTTKEEHRNLELKYSKMVQAKSDLEKRVEELEHQLEQMHGQLQHERQSNTKLHAEYLDAQTELNVYKKEQLASTRERNQLEQRNKELQQAIDSVNGRWQKSVKDYENLVSERASSNNADTQMSSLQKENQDLRLQLTSLQAEKNSINTELNQTKETLQQENQTLRSKVTALESQKEESGDKLASMTTERDKLQLDLNQTKESLRLAQLRPNGDQDNHLATALQALVAKNAELQESLRRSIETTDCKKCELSSELQKALTDLQTKYDRMMGNETALTSQNISSYTRLNLHKVDSASLTAAHNQLKAIALYSDLPYLQFNTANFLKRRIVFHDFANKVHRLLYNRDFDMATDSALSERCTAAMYTVLSTLVHNNKNTMVS